MSILVVDLAAASSSVRQQAAELLVEAFPHANGWPTIEDAIEELADLLTPERRCRAALDADGNLLGWIGSTPGYRGRVWELHPLVVRASARGQGIGRELVRDLERVLCAENALTLWVGTDDEDGETSLAHVNLYPDPLSYVRDLRAPPSHPLGFYLHCGFALSGVVPDANGRGLPGIVLSKRLVMIDAAAIAALYPAIGEILRCDLVARTTNDLVRIVVSNGACWLKLASRSGRTLNELEAEAEVVACLGRCNISVAAPVRRADGRYACVVDGLPSIMFHEARGTEVTSPSREQARALGALIANVHLSSACIRPHRWTIDESTLFHEPLGWLGARVPEEIANIGTDMIARVWSDTLPVGLCHGDLHLENVRFDGDAPTLFDFEACGSGPLVYDLACYWRKHSSEWDALLDGYTSVRALTSHELRVIPALATLRAIWVMALPAAPKATWGRDWLDAEYFEAHLGMIRALAAKT